MRKQVIKTELSRILVGEYKTKSGQSKNRYKNNPDSKPFLNEDGTLRVVLHKN